METEDPFFFPILEEWKNGYAICNNIIKSRNTLKKSTRRMVGNGRKIRF